MTTPVGPEQVTLPLLPSPRKMARDHAAAGDFEEAQTWALVSIADDLTKIRELLRYQQRTASRD